MSVSKIRGFLLQLPKPHAVRVSSDGEPQTLKPSKSFAKTAESIAALGPDLLECLDAEGNILRALRLDDVEARRSDAAPIPDGIKADPNALMLTHFANLIHRAYEHSTETAFVRMVELVDKMNDRSASIEQRLERTEASNRRLLQDQVEDALERAAEIAAQAQQAGGDDSLGANMLQAFLGGVKVSPSAAKPNGTSNGKGQS